MTKIKKNTEIKCKIVGCEKPIVTFKQQLCNGHYNRFLQKREDWDVPLQKRNEERKCVIEDCEKLTTLSCGYCRTHYSRWRIHGDPNVLKIGERGKGHKNKDGYVKVYDKRIGKVIPVHRQVMIEILGRDLFPDEKVHHINGIRDDNRPENLELWCVNHPSGQRVEDLLMWAKEIIERYDKRIK
jgi:hypothetical protein